MKKGSLEASKKVVGFTEYYLRGIIRRFQEDDVFMYGSAIAFNVLLCLIPMLLLLTSVLGMFLSNSALAVTKLNTFLDTAFPDQPYALKIKNSIQMVMDDIIRHRSSFGILSFAFLTWTAAFLFGSVRNVLNRIFGFKTAKLFYLTIIENILAVMVVGILFLGANAFLWMFSVAKSMVGSHPTLETLGLHLVFRSIPITIIIAIALCMFFILFKFIPDGVISSRAAFVSSITATVTWIISGKAFELYLVRFSNIGELYGAYTFLLVLLLWIEYSSIVFIIGGIVGQLYRQKRGEIPAG
jgi:membrane protein